MASGKAKTNLSKLFKTVKYLFLLHLNGLLVKDYYLCRPLFIDV